MLLINTKIYLTAVCFVLCSALLGQKQGTYKKSSAELDKVLDYFKKKKDPEQLQAALFLVNNINGHYSVKNIWLDKNGREIPFETTKFSDIEQAKSNFDKLKDTIQLSPKAVVIKDTAVIKASFLINNIELAYNSWKQNSWSRGYDFKTFCEYILPYRSLTEPMEDWRSEYQSIYEKSIIGLTDKNDPVELCSQIIKNTKHFDFVINRFDPKPLLGPSELLFWRQGNCPDLANEALFACRSLGVAVTFDFTPHYAASSNRHFWNTVIDNKGTHIPFNGNQDLPYIYSPNHRRMGKVFRFAFSEQKQSLASLIPEKQIPDEFLKSRYIIDVTNEYVAVSDINYSFENISASQIGYLCVFNRGSWNTIDWAVMKSQKAVFSNIGRNIVYLPGVFENRKLILEKNPILLNTDGVQTVLKPDFLNLFKADLSRSNENKSNFIDNNPIQIIKGEKYNLFVWNGNWQMIDQQTATEDDLVSFLKIPSNGLFLMAPVKPDFFERIFTVDSSTGKITWY